MSHRYAPYWNMGVQSVPVQTGATHVLNGTDIHLLAAAFGVPLPWGYVLDVGCGTGRLAPWCRHYHGVDIAADAVAYCVQHGRHATLIDGPDDLPPGPFDLIACLSVFTHVDRPERQAYLRAFVPRAARLIVDIIPGTGDGGINRWTADVTTFVVDLDAVGYHRLGEVTLKLGTEPHHYYLAEVA
jgi:SAM-dependent methyltransferase